MKKLALVLIMVSGFIFSANAKQHYCGWKAVTDEDRENVLDYCVLEMKIRGSLGWSVVCFDVTEDGYVIVFEDYE